MPFSIVIKLALPASALLLSGCVSTSFADAVSSFAELSEDAVGSQNTNLKQITDEQRERIANQRAVDRVDFRLTPDCRAQLDPQGAANCSLVRSDGRPIEQVPTFSHILALGKALQEYSASLDDLTQNTDQDQAEFKQSLMDTSQALAGLQGAVGTAFAVEPSLMSEDSLSAVASLAGDLGAAYLENRRAKSLKRLVIEADPTIQDAVTMLNRAYRLERLYNSTGLFRSLQSLQINATRTVNQPGSSVADRRTAQEALFKAVEEARALSQNRDRFTAIGQAHTDLKQAAEKGAGKEELIIATRSILKIAQSIETNVPKITDSDG